MRLSPEINRGKKPLSIVLASPGREIESGDARVLVLLLFPGSDRDGNSLHRLVPW